MIENYDDIDLHNLPEEKQKRIQICSTCPNNVVVDFPKCSLCDCPISALTMFSFKTCPADKW